MVRLGIEDTGEGLGFSGPDVVSRPLHGESIARPLRVDRQWGAVLVARERVWVNVDGSPVSLSVLCWKSSSEKVRSMQADVTTLDAFSGPAERTILVVGDSDRAEMRPLVAWFRASIGPRSHWIVRRHLLDFSQPFAANEFPDLIIVLQSGPYEYSPSEVNQLLASAPLARVVVCYGAWCESDGRNHGIWPLSVRVPVWAAPARIEQEWNLIQAPRDLPPLPWSASREEVFAADHPAPVRALSSQRILINSPDLRYRQGLVEQLFESGHQVVADDPSVLLFDADPWGPTRKADLSSLINRFLPVATEGQESPETLIKDQGTPASWLAASDAVGRGLPASDRPGLGVFHGIGLFAVASLIQPPLVEELGQYRVENVFPKLGPALIRFLSR